MELESHSLFTKNLTKEDVITHIFKLIFISLTLIIGAIIIHLEHTTTTNPSQSDPILYSTPYIFTVSLVKATEQLQDAISLILSNYAAADFDIDAELAWKNCSGSVLNGWGETQDALQHVIMNPSLERLSDGERGEMTRQIAAAEGFIEACVDDLVKVESTAASEVRDKLLLAKACLSGRGEFLSSNSGEMWKRVLRMIVGIMLENLFYIIFCGVELFFILYMFQKLVQFRYD